MSDVDANRGCSWSAASENHVWHSFGGCLIDLPGYLCGKPGYVDERSSDFLRIIALEVVESCAQDAMS